MNIPQTEQIPDNPEQMPPARRRRARRLLAPLNADERAAFLDNVAHRAAPSFDFFLFSLLAGFVFSAGLLLDAPAILILGAILAPLMAPVVGISLGTVIGSGRTFLRNLVGVVIAAGLVFLAGWLVGKGAQAWYMPGPDFTLAHLYAQLSWLDFLVLAIASVLTTAALTHSYDTTAGPLGGSLRSGLVSSAAVPSVALAYELALPLATAGLGLGAGIPDLFPDGLLVVTLHLVWAVLLGALTLALVGFRPLTLFGYTLSGAVLLCAVVLLVGFSGAGTVAGTKMGLPTPVPTSTPTLTLTPTLTATPVPPTATLTPTLTPTLTLTPTPTLTATPTPVFAIVQAGDTAGGAFMRAEPAGDIIILLANGTRVQVLPERVEQGGVTWVKVISSNGVQGWIRADLLVQQ